jgi:hypothetical protein
MGFRAEPCRSAASQFSSVRVRELRKAPPGRPHVQASAVVRIQRGLARRAPVLDSGRVPVPRPLGHPPGSAPPAAHRGLDSAMFPVV